MKKPETKTKTADTARGTAIGAITPVKMAAGSVAGATATVATPKKPFNPFAFMAEVRKEARKITWTSRKETWITTVMVLIMVVLAGIFFYIVDAALGFGAANLIKFGQ